MALTLNQVQRGSSSLGVGIFLTNITIPIAVDMSKTWVRVYGFTNGGTNISESAFTYQLTSTTNIEVRREGSGTVLITLYWEAVEFSDGIASIQRHTTVIGANPTTQPITAVNLANSFVISSSRVSTNPGNGIGDYLIMNSLPFTTSLRFNTNGAANFPIAESQVVELSCGCVIHYTGTTGNNTIEDIPVAPLNTEKAFLIASFWNVNNINVDANQLKTARILDSNTIRLESLVASVLAYSIYVLVPNDIKVQRINDSLAAKTKTNDITSVTDLDLTHINSPEVNGFIGTLNSITEDHGDNFTITKFNGASTSQLITERGNSVATQLNYSKEVIEFNQVAPAPAPGAITSNNKKLNVNLSIRN